MSKLWVFISIVIFTIAFSGCQEEAKITEEQDAPTEQMAVTEQPEAAVEENIEEQVAEPEAVDEKAVKETVAKEAAQAAVVVEEPVAEQETPVAAEEEVVEATDQNPVVVTVNGQDITEKDVNIELQKRLDMMKKRMPQSTEIPENQMQQMRKRVVDMEVEQVLLDQEMQKNNISVSDDQVMEEIKKIAGQRDQTMEDVEAEIAKMGMTLEDIKGQIRMQMQQRALMEALNPDAIVAEEDIKKFYDENPQYFNKPEQVKASHILCGKRGIKEEEYPAELEKIEAAQARLEAGEAFEDVAKDVSTCPSSTNGGDLGFFGKGQMDPAFEKAAFELESGQTSDIVKTSFGYHIIKVTDKKDASKVPFDEAKDQISNFLTQQKQREFWTTYSKTMRDNATIEYSEKEQALRDQMQKAAEAARAARMPKMPAAAQPAPEADPENEK